jgi:hypothetical protein
LSFLTPIHLYMRKDLGTLGVPRVWKVRLRKEKTYKLILTSQNVFIHLSVEKDRLVCRAGVLYM